MKSSPDQLEALANRLSKLAPASPSEALSLRLEAALREASKEVAAPRKVIEYPFAQRIAAAAAMVAALFMAIQSTRSGSGVSPLAKSEGAAAKVAPVYQQVNGRLVPVTDETALRRVKYRGMDVIDGRAVRIYRNERATYFQPFLPESTKANGPAKDVESR